MIVGYHAGGLHETDVEKAADILKDAGYQGIQLAGPVVGAIVEQDAWERAGEVFADRGLRVLMSWGPLPSVEELAAGDESAAGFARWRAEAERVKRAGCEALMMMPKGQRGSAPDVLAKAGRTFVDFARRVYEATGVRASLHQHYNNALETWDDVAAFAETFDGECAALLADTAHLQKSGVDPARYIGNYADRIDMLHIKDVHADGAFAFPGQGTVDFDAVFAAVADMGFDRSIVADVHDVVYDGDLVTGARAFLAHRMAPAHGTGSY